MRTRANPHNLPARLYRRDGKLVIAHSKESTKRIKGNPTK